MHGGWDKERFRELLGRAMADAGLSQRQVADMAGVSHSQISRWKTGQHRPGYDNLRAAGDGMRRHSASLGDLTPLLLAAAGYGGPDGTAGTESPLDLTPECVYEEEILGNEEATQADREQFIRAHRRQGHRDWCRPIAPGQQESAPAEAAG